MLKYSFYFFKIYIFTKHWIEIFSLHTQHTCTFCFGVNHISLKNANMLDRFCIRANFLWAAKKATALHFFPLNWFHSVKESESFTFPDRHGNCSWWEECEQKEIHSNYTQLHTKTPPIYNEKKMGSSSIEWFGLLNILLLLNSLHSNGKIFPHHFQFKPV